MNERRLFFASIFLVFFQVFVAFPISAWAQNKSSFNADLSGFSPKFILITIGAALVAGALSFIIPKKALKRATPLAIVACAALLIQQNFLVWNYGVLDGTDLDFSKNNLNGAIDIGLWMAAGLIGWFLTEQVRIQAQNILIGVGLTASLLAGMNLINYGSYQQDYSITERNKYDFSKDKNVIVFMLDAFQQDLLLELFDQNPEFEQALNGFTLYENNAAVFAKTLPSIPLFLTGKRYHKEQPISEFFAASYDDSLVSDLQKSGWDVGLYPQTTVFPGILESIKLSPSVLDNIVTAKPGAGGLKVYLDALDLSIFRSVPHQLKRTIFNEGEFIAARAFSTTTSDVGRSDDAPGPFLYPKRKIHHALAFDEQLKAHGQVVLDEPAFRFFHLVIPHAPFLLDRNLQKTGHKGSLEAYKDYSYAAWALMNSYLDQLKLLGVYDGATIIILSDHGMAIGNRLQYNRATRNYTPLQKYPLPRAAAKSILLVKKPSDTSALQYSKKPVSGIDVAPTIAQLSGLQREYEGQPVDDIAEFQARERLFNYYSFSTWDSKFLAEFDVYKINGDVRKGASWKSAGKFREAMTIQNASEYRLGKVVSYGRDIKSDTDFHNAFIDISAYRQTANFIVSEDGTLALDVDLKRKPGPSDNLLFQFEIYDGKPVERVLRVNGTEFREVMTPTKRALNAGFRLTPKIHKGQKTLRITFAMPEGSKAVPIHFSTLKISSID